MCVVIFWFTFWPLISEALRRRARPSARRRSTAWIGPLAILLVLLTGLGPGARLAAGDAPPTCAASCCVPGGVRRWRAAPSLLAVTATATSSPALLFVFAAFSAPVIVQEFARGVRARRAMASESRARSRSCRWCAATGAATAATSCTSA